jgi:ligand-binding sensor protein
LRRRRPMAESASRERDTILLDILPQEKWEGILRELSQEVGMPATLVDAKGNILVHVGDYTDICIRVRKRPESLSFVCGQTSQSLMKQAEKTGRPVVELCQIGLCKLIVPLFKEGKFLGALAACSRALSGEELDPFMVAQELGISEEEASKLLSSTPTIEQEFVLEAGERWHQRAMEWLSGEEKRGE